MWQLNMLARLFIGNFISPYFLKKIADLPSKSETQYRMYFYCSIFSILYFIIVSGRFFSVGVLWALPLGFINSFAVYCSFRAVNASLSKTYALYPLSNIAAIVLGYAFLREAQYFNLNIFLGMALCFAAAGFMLFNEGIGKIKTDYAKWIVGISIIGGLVTFFIRFFAMKEIAPGEFLLGWYLGAFVGSALLLKFGSCAEKGGLFPDFKSDFGVIVLALSTWMALLLSFNISRKAPLTVTEPIYLVSSIFLPVMIGLYLFKEIKSISKKEVFALTAGIIGGIVIALSY